VVEARAEDSFASASKSLFGKHPEEVNGTVFGIGLRDYCGQHTRTLVKLLEKLD
jgi:hypothetical protein